MKKIIFTIATIAIMCVQSCKEQIPAGLVLSQTFISVDSEYVSSTIPTAQLKNILVEEFTGVTCSNCPKGAADLKAIEQANAPRILVAKIHNNVQATPIKATDPDLRNEDADAIASSLGFVAKPSAAVDKLPRTSTDYTFGISAVAGKISTQLIKPTPVNINLAKLVNATLDSINIAATFTFTDTTSKKLAFNIYLLEDDVEATQDSFIVATLQKFEIDGYKHEKILRKIITPAIVGTSFPDVLQKVGKVYIRALQFAKPSKVLNINNCLLLVFVHDRDTKEVLHCQEIHL
jgi:Outer membrane protein Omp28